MKEFAGFVFDLDKTAIPNGALTVESQGLIRAFSDLPEDVIAIAATGRVPEIALTITRALGLKHDSVVANGALIVDSQTGEHWWERLLTEDKVMQITSIGKSYNYRMFLAGDDLSVHLTANEQTPRTVSAVFFNDVPMDDAEKIREQVLGIDGVNCYLSPAYGGGINEYDINIGNIEAQKHVALEVLFGKYAVNGSQMIGIGDGINDVELFSVVGHKVAVANAHPQLIELADEVVSSQEDDGLAEVVRRFHR